MKEITDGVWQIDEIGNTVNAYLWRWDNGLVLIDTGMPWHGKTILEAIDRAGFRPGDVREVLVTHADVDHVGGLKTIKEATGARVVVHAVEAMFLKGRWHRYPNTRHPLGLLIFPLFWVLSKTLFRVPPVAPELLVIDQETLDNGLQVIHTPGHTPGHMSLYSPERRILFVGDAIRNPDNRLSPPAPIFTPQGEVALESIRRLARLKDVEIACFGHGPVITSGAGERIRTFAARVAPVRRRKRKAPPQGPRPKPQKSQSRE